MRNLLYRPSLVLLGQVDYAGENGLDLSTTLTCARFCVASAKDTIQLLHSTASRLTGAFWYNIFCTTPSLKQANVDIYTAATVLLGARLCLKRGELDDIEEDWSLALNYLKRISSKSISAERCLKVLEAMNSQLSHPFTLHVELTLDASPRMAQGITPFSQDFKPDPPLQPSDPQPFDPLSAPTNVGMFPAGPSGNVMDWDMQDLVWSNLPWDWNLTDDMLAEELADREWGWGNVAQGDGQVNGTEDQNMGMPVL